MVLEGNRGRRTWQDVAGCGRIRQDVEGSAESAGPVRGVGEYVSFLKFSESSLVDLRRLSNRKGCRGFKRFAHSAGPL